MRSVSLFRYAESTIERIGHAPEERLDLLIGPNALQSLFPAQAAIFEAAKGSGRGKLFVGVDPDHACFQSASHAPGTFVIRSPNSRGQAITDVVRLLNQIVLVFERYGAQYGAKNLLLCNVRLVGDTRDNRRQVERPLGQAWIGGPAAADQNLSPFFTRAFHHAFHELTLRKTGARPELRAGSIGQVHAQGASPFDDHRNHLVVDLALDKQPRTRGTRLARAFEDRDRGRIRRSFEVGIRKNDVRRFSSQLQYRGYDLLARQFGNPSTDLGP